MAETPLIHLRNINKSYTLESARSIVLQDISLDVYYGDMIAIVGASGSGKSTLMNILGLLDKADSGLYRLNEQEVQHLHSDALALLRNKTLSFVFQQFHLLPRFTALQNVMLPLTYRSISHKDAENAAFEALEAVNMHAYIKHKPGQLSGGQQQRVAIARALVTKPAIILADEPTGALDSETGEEIMDLFRKLNRQGSTILLITHDQKIAHSCSRRIHLSDGRIVQEIRE